MSATSAQPASALSASVTKSPVAGGTAGLEDLFCEDLGVVDVHYLRGNCGNLFFDIEEKVGEGFEAAFLPICLWAVLSLLEVFSGQVFPERRACLMVQFVVGSALGCFG